MKKSEEFDKKMTEMFRHKLPSYLKLYKFCEDNRGTILSLLKKDEDESAINDS